MSKKFIAKSMVQKEEIESMLEGGTDEEMSFVDDDTRSYKRRPRTFLWSSLPWFLVVLLTAWIVFSPSQKLARSADESRLWTSSDFISAREAIHRAEVQFTSSLDFTDPDHIYRIYDPSAPVYVGNGSAEVDQNWDDLILPADIYISDEEAETLPPEVDLYRSQETGKFKIELEVFHSLHCLNMIRMRLYGDQYPAMQTHKAKIHVDHCIESLRELIMCEGNMTPIPIEWSEKGGRINPNYAQKHSCRDFEALKEWMRKRTDRSS